MDSHGPLESDLRHTATCSGPTGVTRGMTPTGGMYAPTRELDFLDRKVLHRPVGRANLRGGRSPAAVPETGLRDGGDSCGSHGNCGAMHVSFRPHESHQGTDREHGCDCFQFQIRATEECEDKQHPNSGSTANRANCWT